MGERVLFRDRREIFGKAAEIDEPVPGSGRDGEYREQRSLLRFLCTLAHHDLLDYPLEVERSERPDYLLRLGDRVSGLELTDMGDKKYRRAESFFTRKAPEGRRLTFPPGEVRGPGEHTRSAPALGDEPERTWLDDLESAVRSKSAKLASYQHADDYELLVFDFSASEILTVPAQLLLLAASRMRKISGDFSRGAVRRFSRSSVLRDGRCLLFDLDDQARLLPIFRQGKHLVVVVVCDEGEPPRYWVITAYLARRLSGGTTIWQPPN